MTFEIQDEFEAFLLDFLQYRRKNKAGSNFLAHKKSIPVQEKQYEPDMPLLLSEIGKGWPHYKKMMAPTTDDVKTDDVKNDNMKNEPALKNEIIQILEPIVQEVVTQYGQPKNPTDLMNLNHRVIIHAMTLPMVSDSIRMEEAKPWGRVSLLQAVVELLILLFINGNRMGESKCLPFV